MEMDTVKTLGTSTGTLTVNFLKLVPELLGVVLIIMNIIYVARKIQQTFK
jgi:flagellar biogenesis protein FliO